MAEDCVFCRIIAGALPSARVYEDDNVLAFMDIGPMVKGHTLVIPKLHCRTIGDTPLALLGKIMEVVQRIASAQKDGLGAEGVSVIQSNGEAAGQVVPHMHFHVVPRFATDGQPRGWTPLKYDTPDEMQGYATRIEESLSGL